MTAVELLKHAMRQAEGATLPLILDMRDAPLTTPTTAGGNHPHWILGHLATSEAGIYSVMTGEPHPLGHWQGMFGKSSSPDPQGKDYPGFDELLAEYQKYRAKNLELLDSLADADLDAPSKAVPPGMEAVFGTLGKCFLVLGQHTMMHRGQVADCRRAAGRPPLQM